MSQDWSSGEHSFQSFKSFSSSVGEVPCGALLGESSEWYGNVGVVGDETTVEVCEAQEGLYVLNFLRFQANLG